MLTAAFLVTSVVSLQRGLDGWIRTDALVLCEESGPTLTWNISVLLWKPRAELDPKVWAHW